MINLSILYLGYLIILFSIIGFGYLSSKILSIRLLVCELGLSGILFMTICLRSYITNLNFPHNFIHNSIFSFRFSCMFFTIEKDYLKKE